jgi:hypothetical protein
VPTCDLKKLYNAARRGNKSVNSEMVSKMLNKTDIAFDKKGNPSMYASPSKMTGTSSAYSAAKSVKSRPSYCFRVMGKDDPSRQNHFLKRPDEGLFFNLNYRPELGSESKADKTSLMDSRFKQQ